MTHEQIKRKLVRAIRYRNATLARGRTMLLVALVFFLLLLAMPLIWAFAMSLWRM